jgi:glycosyltransferase involved in cell wall biosynthesis
MLIIYASDAIGSKVNGGAGLSGLRFLELLANRYQMVQYITDASRGVNINNSKINNKNLKIIKLKRRAEFDLAGLRSIIKFSYIKFINLFRSNSYGIKVGNSKIILVSNTFNDVFDRVNIEGRVFTVCVVRGDVNSFDFQAFGPPGNFDPLDFPIKYLSKFDALIFVSQTIKNNWEAFEQLKVKNNYLLPNAIDEDEVVYLSNLKRKDVANDIGFSLDEVNIVVLGSLQERKGQSLFIEILKRLGEINTKIKIHFVGGVSSLWGGDVIKSKLISADIYGICKFYGHRDDALSFVHASDIAVMTSYSEAFPRTVAEYMSLGKPIITTSVAGAVDMIKDGENGCVIDRGSSSQLLEKILMLIESPNLRESLGRRAKLDYENKYSQMKQQDGFKLIFDDIEQRFGRGVK